MLGLRHKPSTWLRHGVSTWLDSRGFAWLDQRRSSPLLEHLGLFLQIKSASDSLSAGCLCRTQSRGPPAWSARASTPQPGHVAPQRPPAAPAGAAGLGVVPPRPGVLRWPRPPPLAMSQGAARFLKSPSAPRTPALVLGRSYLAGAGPRCPSGRDQHPANLTLILPAQQAWPSRTA